MTERDEAVRQGFSKALENTGACFMIAECDDGLYTRTKGNEERILSLIIISVEKIAEDLGMDAPDIFIRLFMKTMDAKYPEDGNE